jgi:hypothetical protein
VIFFLCEFFPPLIDARPSGTSAVQSINAASNRLERLLDDADAEQGVDLRNCPNLTYLNVENNALGRYA